MYLPHAAVAQEQKRTWQVLTGKRLKPKPAIPRAWWATIGLLLFAVLLLYVHTVVVEANLDRQERSVKHMQDQLAILRAQRAAAQSPAGVEDKALNQLAMQEPKEVLYMVQSTQMPQAIALNILPPPQAVIHQGF
jgi:hypothetical protein